VKPSRRSAQPAGLESRSRQAAPCYRVLMDLGRLPGASETHLRRRGARGTRLDKHRYERRFLHPASVLST